MNKNYKSGFVGIIGRPNVGKSTLLNALLNKKVSIVTSKAQTTRNRINGILTKDDCQYIFMDTPGIHTAQHELGKFMNNLAINATNSNDVILFLAPADEIIDTGIKYYPDEMQTDQPERFLIREVIREQILIQTEEEIPHSVAILIDKMEDKQNVVVVQASIICERPTQKGILIGHQGKKIKNIGIEVRKNLEQILNTKVFLELFVKVQEKWRNSASLIKKLGYDRDDY
ncbi:hypothetical protein FQR65_LT16625 [Abscondita terminalis]|nr:hypothetical protein FQR65_LT16625 [Abscondita terminalis]